ncbi:DUF1016 N-terminal domain-containing protein [Bradyrhizobium daqingense]|nr:DUF1016 N-terminal domain-containing protein [Bradyrhizobium daqingense]UFS90630.1 DUF1016 N-terminal domain-containing protein [Bradyrhizobium daqingense]
MSSRPRKPPRRSDALGSAGEVDAQSYTAFVGDLKQKIAAARHRASLSINRELVTLYWTIGRDILERQEREGWGARVPSAIPKTRATSSSPTVGRTRLCRKTLAGPSTQPLPAP